MSYRFCGKMANNDDEGDYYVPGYKLNYSTSQSSISTHSTVNEKPKHDSNKQKNVSSRSLIYTNHELIADRCRIALEGRGNFVSIEGHSASKNMKK